MIDKRVLPFLFFVFSPAVFATDSIGGGAQVVSPSKYSRMVQVPQSRDYQANSAFTGANGNTTPSMKALSNFINNLSNECTGAAQSSTQEICYVAVKASKSTSQTLNTAKCPQGYEFITSTDTRVRDADATGSTPSYLIYTSEDVTPDNYVNSDNAVTFYKSKNYDCGTVSYLQSKFSTNSKILNILSQRSPATGKKTSTTQGSSGTNCNVNWPSYDSTPAAKPTAANVTTGFINVNGQNVYADPSTATTTGNSCRHDVNNTQGGCKYYTATAHDSTFTECGIYTYNGGYNWYFQNDWCEDHDLICHWEQGDGGHNNDSFYYFSQASVDYNSYYCARPAGFYDAPSGSQAYNLPTASYDVYTPPTVVICGKKKIGTSNDTTNSINYWQALP